jgi:hypothetical protein
MGKLSPHFPLDAIRRMSGSHQLYCSFSNETTCPSPPMRPLTYCGVVRPVALGRYKLYLPAWLDALALQQFREVLEIGPSSSPCR